MEPPVLQPAWDSPCIISVFGFEAYVVCDIFMCLYIVKWLLCSFQDSVYDRAYGWEKLYIFPFIGHLLLLPNKGYKFTDRIYDFITSILKKFCGNVCSWSLTVLMGIRNHAKLENVSQKAYKAIYPHFV